VLEAELRSEDIVSKAADVVTSWVVVGDDKHPPFAISGLTYA